MILVKGEVIFSAGNGLLNPLIPSECLKNNTFSACGVPQLASLGSSLVNFFISLSTILFVFLLIRVGWNIILNGEQTSGRASEIERVRKALYGVAIAFLAFPIVYFIFQTLGFKNGDPFFVDENLTLPKSNTVIVKYPIVDYIEGQSKGTAINIDPDGTTPSATISAYSNVTIGGTNYLEYLGGDDIDLGNICRNADGNTAGHTSCNLFKNNLPKHRRILKGILIQESGSCRALQSSAGALGCMQILPATAIALDSPLRNLPPEELHEKLRNDHKYNINLGAKYYFQQLQAFRGNERYALAAYNGGPGANRDSTNCQGARRWECPFDSGAAIQNSEGTWVCEGCRLNTGYSETRNYVERVLEMVNSGKL